MPRIYSRNAVQRNPRAMIGRLTGRVHDEGDSLDVVVLDVQGVGYEVTVPLGTLGRAPRTDAGLVTLFIHTHVREDALALFGFASETDRITFKTLIDIPNVGPKTAITILSVLPAEDLARAVTHGDLGRLTSIPGVGKKTAERLVLELKDKLAKKVTSAASPAVAPKPVALTAQSDVLRDALVRMGYRPAEADRAVSALHDRVATQPIGQSLREALALLAK
jgi:Holliday junction DNA helicase RuvA